MVTMGIHDILCTPINFQFTLFPKYISVLYLKLTVIIGTRHIQPSRQPVLQPTGIILTDAIRRRDTNVYL